MKLIALDPGGTTGWATCRVDLTDAAFTASKPEYEWHCGHIEGDDHHDKLYQLLELQEDEHHCVVICESFEFRQFDKRDRHNINLMSREYIGVTKLFCQERTTTELVMQTAATGKGFVKDENIKKLGLWHPGWKHAMDATRHLLYYMVNTLKCEDLLRQGWR